MAGSLVAEGRESTRQGYVVVYGLGHVNDLEAALGLLGDPVGHEQGAFASDGQQVVDAHPPDGRHQHAKLLLHVVRIIPRGPQDRAAPRRNPRDLVDGERPDLVFPAFEERLETAHYADDVHPLVDPFYGSGAYDAVDARRRTAADDYCQHLFLH